MARSGENANGDLLVPLHVKPISDHLALFDRQLDNPELFDGRRRKIERHGRRWAKRIGFFRQDEILELECHIVTCRLYADYGIIRRNLESDNELVSFAANAICLVGRAHVLVGKFYFIVEWPKLRNRTERDRIAAGKQFLSVRLGDKRLDNGVVADRQSEASVLDDDIFFRTCRGIERQGEKSRRHRQHSC